jgi:phage baseplate assembly protein W
MALSPLQQISERIVVVTDTSGPSKTYAFNFDTGEIGGIVDEEKAIRQFVRKTITTPRFRFLIYDDQYGCELENLIGQDVTNEYLEHDIPRMITEALVYDDRISNVTDFVITRDSDKVYVSFTLVTSDGTLINEEVTI